MVPEQLLQLGASLLSLNINIHFLQRPVPLGAAPITTNMLGRNLAIIRSMHAANRSTESRAASPANSSAASSPTPSLSSNAQYLAGAQSGPLPVFVHGPMQSNTPDSDPWLDNRSRESLVRRMSDPSRSNVVALRSTLLAADPSSGTRTKRKFSELLDDQQTLNRRIAPRRRGFSPRDLYDLDSVSGLTSSDDENVNSWFRPPTSNAQVTLQYRRNTMVGRYPAVPRPSTRSSMARTRGIGTYPALTSYLGAQQPSPYSLAAMPDPARYSTFLIHLTEDDIVDQSGTRLKRTIKYLPLVPDPRVNHRDPRLVTLPSHCARVDAIPKSKVKFTWPAGQVPLDVFLLIVKYLARDDVKNMRMVNREFEFKLSPSLFHTTVVPFNTELYDMMDNEIKQGSPPTRKPKVKKYLGKGKKKAVDGQTYVQATESPFAVAGKSSTLPPWRNANEDEDGKVYHGHGLRVFQGFGPHMKRFGMSFELSETQLAYPGAKKNLNVEESYHGSYPWPPTFYARFDGTLALENTADEHNRMLAAFSELNNVKELALSIDSGLGWLTGPDVSVYGQVFEKKTPIFGSPESVPTSRDFDPKLFWAAYVEMCARKYPGRDAKETLLKFRTSKTSKADLDASTQAQVVKSDEAYWKQLNMNRLHPFLRAALSDTELDTGLLYPSTDEINETEISNGFWPSNLRRSQKEWLLEMEWAQRAFLDTYMLAVIGNQRTFGANITSMKITKLSSGLVPMFQRAIFWESLPNVAELVFHVKPDWRVVHKDSAGWAQTPYRHPSNAVNVFNKMASFIAKIESIGKLSIGWTAGGENAQGVMARNRHILPAPVTDRVASLDPQCESVVTFPHVEHLTLFNCWLTPTTLEYFVSAHANCNLNTLVLDSVSLTARPSDDTAQTIAAAIQGLEDSANGSPSLPDEDEDIDGLLSLLANAAHHQTLTNNAGFININPMQQLPPIVGNTPAPLVQFAPGPYLSQHQVQILTNNGPNNPLATHANNFMPAVVAAAPMNLPHPPPPPPPFQPFPHWTGGHRPGSWPRVLDVISPGPHFADYIPAPQPWEEPHPPRPATNLNMLELKSCGYVKIVNVELIARSFHQSMFDERLTRSSSAWFRGRIDALKRYMLSNHDLYTGKIVQGISERELNAVQFAWRIREGWEDTEKAEEATYDGALRGGTGRISGVIGRDMDLNADGFAT